jgi:hypothetical protein
VINNGKKDTNQDTSINTGNLNCYKGKPNGGVFTEQDAFTNLNEPFNSAREKYCGYVRIFDLAKNRTASGVG